MRLRITILEEDARHFNCMTGLFKQSLKIAQEHSVSIMYSKRLKNNIIRYSAEFVCTTASQPCPKTKISTLYTFQKIPQQRESADELLIHWLIRKIDNCWKSYNTRTFESSLTRCYTRGVAVFFTIYHSILIHAWHVVPVGWSYLRNVDTALIEVLFFKTVPCWDSHKYCVGTTDCNHTRSN